MVLNKIFAPLITVLLLLPVGAQNKAPVSNQKTVLFAVSKTPAGVLIDPIVIIHKGRFTQPPSGTSEVAALTRMARDYYRAGQKYRLIFGGGAAGDITVKKWMGKDAECARTQARVEAKGAGAARLKDRVMAIATNATTLGGKTISRRQPTATERRAIFELAQKTYHQKGVAENLLAAVKQLNVTAVDLNGDGRDEIIGTFVIKKQRGVDAAYLLLLFVEPKGKEFKVTLSQYGAVTEKDLMSGASIDQIGEEVLAQILVDHLDLDGDGLSEVIIADTSFEGITYRIYKKRGSAWSRVYEFYNYRCAY